MSSVSAEIVVDALETARWRCRPETGTVVHVDRRTQYTSWIFGHRLRQTGHLVSMGGIATGVDSALVERYWSTMQRELLDRTTWASKTELCRRPCSSGLTRRNTALGNLSPVEFEQLLTVAAT